MKTNVYFHPDTLAHDTGPFHPERKERLLPLLDDLQKRPLKDVRMVQSFGPVDMSRLESVHAPHYIQRLHDAVQRGDGLIDCGDCPLSPATWEAALLAAGAGIHAVRSVLAGDIRSAFCAVRPPGHHAVAERAMGFCYFNNVALAAEEALADPGCSRVAILDWDAHHGNGTQDAFYSRDDVLYISLHGDPRITYPGTGFAHETGRGAGEGFTLNCPIDPSLSERDVLLLFEQQVLPSIEAFRPELILVSCGFDGHREDPLVPNVALSDSAYSEMNSSVCSLAGDLCEGRLVVLLEGGYSPTVVARLSREVLMSLPGQARP